MCLCRRGFQLVLLLLEVNSGGVWVALSYVCLNSSFQLSSSPLFRLYSDIILYLDRLNVSYVAFHRFCQAGWNLYPELRGSGVIKPRLSFLLEGVDIFFIEVCFFVSLLLLGHHGAQLGALQKWLHFSSWHVTSRCFLLLMAKCCCQGLHRYWKARLPQVVVITFFGFKHLKIFYTSLRQDLPPCSSRGPHPTL